MDLRLDTDHDIYIEAGDLVIIGEDSEDAEDVKEECKQQIFIAYKMRLGEYPLDTSKGTPYMEARAGRYTLAGLSARMRAVMESIPLVEQVTDVNITRTDRDISVDITGKPFESISVRT